MSIDFYKESNFHNITQIDMIYNKDGIHGSTVPIGCVDENSFVVLTNLITRYFVSSYNNQELYPISFCSFPWTISIKNLGNKYYPNNFTIHSYESLSCFEKLNENKLQNASIDKMSNCTSEYLNLLKSAKNRIPSVQKAIDLQSILQIPNGKNIFDHLKTYECDDEETMLLLINKFKTEIENKYQN